MAYFLKNKSLILKIIQIVIANTLLNPVVDKTLTLKDNKNGIKMNVALSI